MKESKQHLRKTLVADAREAIEGCAGLNARLAARQITKFMDKALERTGISLAQFGLLALIAAARDDRIGALAERSGLDPSTLSRNLRHLEAAGLIEMVTVEADLRRRAVWLTERGAKGLESAMPAWRLAQKALAEVVEPQQLRVLAAKTRGL